MTSAAPKPGLIDAMRNLLCAAAWALLGLMPILPPHAASAEPAAYQIVSHGLVGVGRIPAAERDGYRETAISASGLAIDLKHLRRGRGAYYGVLYLLPDRGWNTQGTIDFRPRIQKVSFVLQPANGPAAAPDKTLTLKRIGTFRLADGDGRLMSGLDAAGVRPASSHFPELPLAPNDRVSLDSESIARAPDGSFFIGDEYGPYVYRFSSSGRMLAAIQPPQAFLPLHGNTLNFSSKSPEPDSGRSNNQGFEGLSLTPDGKTLAVIAQSALHQDRGVDTSTRGYTRMLLYDVADLKRPKLLAEHVVLLPEFTDAEGKIRIAAQSELLALDEKHFLLLCRDSDNGFGANGKKSQFRKIMLLDITGADDIKETSYDVATPTAPGGKLAAAIKNIAKLTPFIDINEDAQLARFGLNNGRTDDRRNLSEKWESMTLAPALDQMHPDDYFLFVGNDNDFITQRGFQAGKSYADKSGVDVDTTVLVYRVTLPKRAR